MLSLGGKFFSDGTYEKMESHLRSPGEGKDSVLRLVCFRRRNWVKGRIMGGHFNPGDGAVAIFGDNTLD